MNGYRVIVSLDLSHSKILAQISFIKVFEIRPQARVCNWCPATGSARPLLTMRLGVF